MTSFVTGMIAGALGLALLIAAFYWLVNAFVSEDERDRHRSWRPGDDDKEERKGEGTPEWLSGDL